jgi:hypothetical protein
LAGASTLQNEDQQFRFNKGHVTRQEKHCTTLCGRKCSMNAADWSATWHDITLDDADGPPCFFCDSLYVPKHGLAPESKLAFIATHSLAQSSSQDANFTGT